MENYTLKTTFPNAYCPDELADAKVTKISADAQTREIKADVTLGKVVESHVIDEFCKAVKEEYSLEAFAVNVSFDMENADACECAKFCIDKLGEEEPFYKAIFDCCFINECDGKLKITLRHGNEELLLEEGIDKKISDSLKKNFGIYEDVVFDCDEMVVETKLEPVVSAPKAQAAPQKLVSVAAEGALIGKPFTPNDITEIKDIDNYSGACMICGDISDLIARKLRKLKNQ